MINHKRLFSLLLAFVMLMGLVPAAALTTMAETIYTVSGTVTLAWSEGSTTTVQLLQDGAVVQEFESTDQTFDYSFTGVAAGTYVLQIDATFCEDLTQTITVSDSDVVVNADLPRKVGDVYFCVFCEDGQQDDPTQPLTIELIKDGQVQYTSQGYCGNGVDEVYVYFQNVQMGVYTVRMSKEGYAEEVLEGFWVAGGFAGTTQLYRPFGQVYGYVVATGVKTEQILLELLQGEQVVATTTTTVGVQDYEFEDRLPYGDYTLRVTLAGHQTYTQSVTIDSRNEYVSRIQPNPQYGTLYVYLSGIENEVCVEVMRQGHLFKYQNTTTDFVTFRSLLANDYVIRVQDLTTNRYVYKCEVTLEPAGAVYVNAILNCVHETTSTTTEAATCTTAGTRTVICDICGCTVSVTDIPALGHSYTEGVCDLCGEADPDYVPVQKFNLAGMTMSLGNSLAANFVVANMYLDGDGYYAVITKQYANSEPVTVIIPMDQWQDYGSAGKYFTYTGVTAKEMTDTITVDVYNADDVRVMNTYTRTIEDYIYQMLLKTDVSKEQTLYVDLLNYGAAAQDFFDDYNIENLANARLTEEQLAWATTEYKATDIRVNGDGYLGSTVSLKNEIAINFVFSNAILANAKNATVSFTDHYGNLKEVSVDVADFEAYGTAGKYVVVTGMAIADCGQVITVKLNDAEGNVLSTNQDSVEAYIARMTGNPDAIYPAIMKLATSAYNYFHS